MAKNKKTVKRKKGHGTGILFTLCLLLVLAPFAVLGWILFSASLNTGAPVLGNRFEGDLDPAITSTQLNDVENAVAAVEGVDSSFISMTTATLRVYADVADDASEETVNAVADSLYAAVASVLDPSVYFTKTEDKKMYDMEIHVYTIPERLNAEGENFIYVINTKTSNMSEPAKQTVSVAKNAEVAAKLRQDVEDRRAAQEAAQQEQNSEAENGEVSGGEDVQGEDVQGEATE